MKEIVIMTEESSIQPVFEKLASQLNLFGSTIRVVPHQGVSDLERSLSRKLRAWRNPQARFLIIRDNDSGNCVKRKQRLQEIVRRSGRENQSLVRIICQELEAWFLGDRQALHDASILGNNISHASIRGDVDQIAKPSQKIDRLAAQGYKKRVGARLVAPHMEIDRNTSRSFQNTMKALERLAQL